MRKSYSILMFVFLLGMLCELHASFPKLTLIERFTGINCGPCANYNANIYSAWVAANDHNAAIITYHVPWPSSSVTEIIYGFSRSLSDIRATYHAPLGVPATCVNNKIAIVPTGYAEVYTAAEFTNFVNTDKATQVPMSITPKMEIVDGVANVTVDVFSEEAMDNIRVQILILESVVLYRTAPGTNGETNFPYVARYALPDMNGENFTIAANETKTFTHSQTLSSVLNQKRLYVVAFVETTSGAKNVVQAGMSVDDPPMPRVTEVDITSTQNTVYSVAKKDEIVKHELTVANNWDYDVEVVFEEALETNENWEIISSNLPTETVTLAPEESIDIVQEVKWIGTDPSVNSNVISATATITAEEYANITEDIEIYSKEITPSFVEVSDNVKYAFLTNMMDYNDISVVAFSSAEYFDGKLVAIPYYSSQLFATDMPIIDSLEFLGMDPDNLYFIRDTVLYGNATMNKIKALPDLKLFLGLNAYTYYYHHLATYSPYQAVPNAFLHDVFGVENTIEPYYIFAWTPSSTPTMVVIDGAANDPIAAALPRTVVNSNGIDYAQIITYFNVLVPETTTPVYTAKTTEVTPVQNVAVMAKYEDGDTRRVISGFNFSMLPITPTANPHITILANSIVNWLFNVTSIDDNEINLASNSEISISAFPHPITSTSEINVQNIKGVPVSARVYLLDVSGSQVLDLFNGTLNTGDNKFELTNSALVAGNYFVIAETAFGKTYIPIIISK